MYDIIHAKGGGGLLCPFIIIVYNSHYLIPILRLRRQKLLRVNETLFRLIQQLLLKMHHRCFLLLLNLLETNFLCTCHDRICVFFHTGYLISYTLQTYKDCISGQKKECTAIKQIIDFKYLLQCLHASIKYCVRTARFLQKNGLYFFR